MTDSIVRLALPSEEDDVVEVLRELHGENGLFAMDDGMVRATLQKAFRREGGIVGVIGEPGKIEAIIFMVISNFWYSKEPHLEELVNYCRPEFRRSGHAKHMIEFAKQCATQLHMPLIIGVISNERTEAKVRLYQRQLDRPVGAFFRWPNVMAN